MAINIFFNDYLGEVTDQLIYIGFYFIFYVEWVIIALITHIVHIKAQRTEKNKNEPKISK